MIIDFALSLIIATAFFISSGLHIVKHYYICPVINGIIKLCKILYLDFYFHAMRYIVPYTFYCISYSAGSSNMIVFQHDSVKQPKPVIESAAAYNGIFFKLS